MVVHHTAKKIWIAWAVGALCVVLIEVLYRVVVSGGG